MIEGAQTDALRLDTLERWSPPTHFGKRHRVELQNAADVTVLTGAVATGLIHSDGQVTAVSLRTVKGNKRLSVTAGTVVLAGGGLEVPRLLLHTATDKMHALGDQSGWLGRGYMSHVGGVIAKLHISPGRHVVFGYEQDGEGVYLRRRLTLSATAQAEHRLPNMYALLDRPLLHDASHNSAILSLTFLVKQLVQRQSKTDRSGETGSFSNYKRHLRNLLFGAPEVLSVLPRFGRKRFLTGRRLPSLLLKSDDNSFYLYFHAEQSAHRDSHLTLASDTDSMGMRRLQIEAKLTEADAQGIVRAHQVIGAELEKTGAGRLEFLGPDPLVLVKSCKSTLGHHIGATRMAANPGDGVVDSNCRVFGTRNLYVASASTLPGSSQAHPTLTVLALALRLSDHVSLR
jgi:choline dehydrogenase-like flavoprotein